VIYADPQTEATPVQQLHELTTRRDLANTPKMKILSVEGLLLANSHGYNPCVLRMGSGGFEPPTSAL
jgi:hypothetical protein